MPDRTAQRARTAVGVDRTCGVCGGDVPAGDRCGCLDVLDRFHEAMLAELEANAGKGGRSSWKSATDPRWLLTEVFDHAAKLHLAAIEHVRRSEGAPPRPLPWGDRDTKSLVREFAADTANMAMMLADALGAVDDAS